MSVQPEVAFPDAELLLRSFLTANITARVVTDLPGDLEAQVPVVRIERFGGPGSFVLDNPAIDVDCYATTRAEVSSLARDVSAVVRSMRGISVGGGVVATVSEDSGPSRRPDFNSNVRCFGMTYRLTIRPA